MSAAAQQRGTQPQSESAAPLAARIVRKGETFAIIAQELFGDAKAEALLREINPGVKRDGARLTAGQALRVPTAGFAHRWLQGQHIGLGFEVGAVRGLAPVPSWGAFTRPATPRAPGADLAAYLASTMFSARLDAFEELDEDARGEAVWHLLERVDGPGMQQLLAASSASAASSCVGDARVFQALERAAEARVAEQLEVACRDLLRRCGDALTASTGRPERLARLLLALPGLATDLQLRLLRLFGLDRAEAADVVGRLSQLPQLRDEIRLLRREPGAGRRALVARARDRGEDLLDRSGLRLLERAQRSAAARDLLAARLMGLGQVMRRLGHGLPMFAAAARALTSTLGRREVRAYIARELDFVRARVRAELHVVAPKSLLGLALERSAQQRCTRVSGPMRAAVQLAAVLGEVLLDIDASSLERGLAPVLHARGGAARSDRKVLVGAPELKARLAEFSVRSAACARDAELLAQIAADLARAPLFRDLMSGVASKGERCRLLSARVARTFTRPAAQQVQLSAAELERDLRIYLDNADALRSLYPDIERRRQLVVALLERRASFLEEVAARLSERSPLIGRTRLSGSGAALLLAAWLLEHARELEGRSAPAARGLAAVRGLGGQVIQSCERRLLRALDAATL